VAIYQRIELAAYVTLSYSFAPQNLQYLASRSWPSALQAGQAWPVAGFLWACDHSTVTMPVGTAMIE
jgi:hypothetical protein